MSSHQGGWEGLTAKFVIELSQMAFLTLVLPEDDRKDSVQQEQPDLPYWTMILAICALVDASKYLDILTFWNFQ